MKYLKCIAIHRSHVVPLHPGAAVCLRDKAQHPTAKEKRSHWRELGVTSRISIQTAVSSESAGECAWSAVISHLPIRSQGWRECAQGLPLCTGHWVAPLCSRLSHGHGEAHTLTDSLCNRCDCLLHINLWQDQSLDQFLLNGKMPIYPDDGTITNEMMSDLMLIQDLTRCLIVDG